MKLHDESHIFQTNDLLSHIIISSGKNKNSSSNVVVNIAVV